MNSLEEAIEITPGQYMNLNDPIFKGQTVPDDDGKYWMVFENNGVLYKIENSLHTYTRKS